MGGRKFEDIQPSQLADLSAFLRDMAGKCSEAAEKLGSEAVYTDGAEATRKGLTALRNIIAKQLGVLNLPALPEFWQVERKAKDVKTEIKTKRKLARKKSSR